MKPHSAPKTARAAAAAARTYLRAHIGWLRGFPAGDPDETGLAWVTLPRLGSPARPSDVKITRDLLRRAQFARNSAGHKFPGALPQIVGDMNAWTERSDVQLDLLKAAIHSGTALPDLHGLLDAVSARRATKQRVAQLLRRDGVCEPIIAALIWVHWHDDAGFAAAFDPVEQQAAALACILGLEELIADSLMARRGQALERFGRQGRARQGIGIGWR